MDKLFGALLLGFVVFLAGCASAGVPEAGTVDKATGVAATGVEHIVEMQSTGFSPRILSMGLGDTVTFVNKDKEKHWPASDIHPTHGIYPTKGGCIGSKFDACKGLKEGKQYSFTFYHKGSWCFHDHLKPNLVGCVDVQ